MRKTLCASVLVLSLCGSAFAGDMGTPPVASGDINSPPAASQSDGAQTTDGSTDTGASGPTADMAADGEADSLAAAALSFLDSVLALL